MTTPRWWFWGLLSDGIFFSHFIRRNKKQQLETRYDRKVARRRNRSIGHLVRRRECGDLVVLSYIGILTRHSRWLRFECAGLVYWRLNLQESSDLGQREREETCCPSVPSHQQSFRWWVIINDDDDRWLVLNYDTPCPRWIQVLWGWGGSPTGRR